VLGEGLAVVGRHHHGGVLRDVPGQRRQRVEQPAHLRVGEHHLAEVLRPLPAAEEGELGVIDVLLVGIEEVRPQHEAPAGASALLQQGNGPVGHAVVREAGLLLAGGLGGHVPGVDALGQPEAGLEVEVRGRSRGAKPACFKRSARKTLPARYRVKCCASRGHSVGYRPVISGPIARPVYELIA
jgi:hypothetical protein